ncbi:MAG: enoyl-CoA hydratase/isomerase family protein [Burkholderiales bacterium]
MTAEVLYDVRDQTAWITLNRPEAMNAISENMRAAIPEALARAEADDNVRVIVFSGAGERAFCAGADVKGFVAVESLVKNRQSRAHTHWILAFDRARKPIIAAIHGYCLGGGLEIALACDIRIAADGAKFGLPEVSRGTLPGSGGTQRLARMVGLGRALDIALSADHIGAEDAFRMGLVSRLVPRAELMSAADALAKRIAEHAPLSVLLVKEAVRGSLETDLPTGLRIEADLSTLIASTEDRIEAGAAFREKRKPKFKGR